MIAAGDPTMLELRAAEAEVAHLEAQRDRLRAQVVGAMGFGAPAVSVAGHGRRGDRGGWYPLVAVSLFGVVLELPRGAMLALATEIAGMLGTSRGAVGGSGLFGAIALACGAIGGVALVNHRSQRARLTVASTGGAALLMLIVATTTSSAAFAALLVGLAVLSGAAAALHRPLLVDQYPVRDRWLVLGCYRGARLSGLAVSFAVTTLCSEGLDLTWRAVFLALAVIGAAVAALGTRLRDPGYGPTDMAAFEQGVDDDEVRESLASADEADRTPRLLETFRRHMLTPHLRTLLNGYVVLGFLLVAVPTYLFAFLDEEWGSSVGESATFFSVVLILAVGLFAAALVGAGRRPTADPGAVLQVAGWSLLAAAGCIAVAVLAPVFALMAVLVAAGMALSLVAATALDLATMTVTDAESRPHAAALSEIAAVAVGGVTGAMLMGTLERRLGYTVALGSVLVAGAFGAAMFRKAAARFPADVESVADALIEAAEIKVARRNHRHLPLLACRHIDFSYGQLQVLFDVSFTVDAGEMVALLGTNGAGKSTLLRAISGLATPTRGSVRYNGTDITHMGAEERVRAGIVQVPGGKAVFGRMPVHENLRIQGYTMTGGRAAVDAAIEEVFAAFPALAARRNQLGSTLSGGEQQMLALGKALMLRPRLLLIDELSLGLAPVIVSELLDIVRAIREAGTAVVLVEQSVNVALSLADHAYFMEKGQIGFDGPAQSLLGRDDLLRSVFLRGAARGLASVGDVAAAGMPQRSPARGR